VDRWFDLTRRALFVLCADGAILWRPFGGGYKVFSRFIPKNPNGTTLPEYLEKKQRQVTRQCESRPGLRCHCETPHNLREWSKTGRPAPCPCPDPRHETLKPTATREIKTLPSFRSVERWVFDSVAEATDGCQVEPDGHCQHGAASWLLVLGLI